MGAGAGVAAMGGLMMASGGGGGGKNTKDPWNDPVSSQDKEAGLNQLNKLAKENGFENFHIFKKDQGLDAEWDAFFTKAGQLYFKRKTGK
jgi:hypothetical protein